MKTEIFSLKKVVQTAITLFVLCVGVTTHAYNTTSQEAVVLESKTILFTIEYEFGVKNHDLIMPVLAQHNGVVATNTLTYTILDQDGTPAKGSMVGIVFSDASLTNDGMYAIDKGNPKKFSLNVLFTPESPKTEVEYRLQVTSLPFSFDRKQQLQLNEHELSHYTTDLIGL